MSDTDSANTFLSWVTNLTTCEPIEKALKTFENGSTKFHRKVLEIITSMKNTIIEKGGSESSLEFYATMISFLKMTEVDIETMDACVFILKHLIRQSIPAPVLRHTTSDLSKIILTVLSGSFGKNESIVKTALFILSKLISVQSDDNWNTDNVTHLYRSLFSYTTDSRPKINKEARRSVLSIFLSKTKAGGLLSRKHPLNRETINILTNSIKTQNSTNKKRNNLDVNIKTSPEDDRLSFSLTMIACLMKSQFFNSDSLVAYLETLIQCLLSLQIVKIQCQILRIFSDLFVQRVLFPEQIARSITSLFAYLQSLSGKPASKSSSTPVPPTVLGSAWLNTIMMGLESLLLNEQTTFTDSASGQVLECRFVALTHATNLLKFCCDWLLCDNAEFNKVVLSVLVRLTTGNIVTSEFKLDCIDPDQIQDADVWLSKWAEIACRLLLVHNTVLWAQVIDNLTNLVVRSKGKCEKMMSVITRFMPQIAELRDSYEDTEADMIASLTKDRIRNVKESLTVVEKTLKNAIESLVGNVIKFYGLGCVVAVMPLTELFEESDDLEMLSTRSWIVPVIKAYTESTSLDQFRLHILPCIHLLTKKIDQSSTSNQMEVDNPAVASSVAVMALGTLRYQLWSCLPVFAKKCIPGSIRQVSENLVEPLQHPSAYPSGVDYPRITMWDLVLDLLNPTHPSNLEVVALTAVRNLASSAQDKDEMRAVLTSDVLFPKILQNLFGLYMKKDFAIQTNIKSTLDVYLPLFAPETFDGNCQFLVNKKLADMDVVHPSENHLFCVELLIILGPHLSVATMTGLVEYLAKFLDNDKASNLIHKRVYRFFEIISASNTETSNTFTKTHMTALLDKFRSWTQVKTDSWKCRMKCLHNFFKLMNTKDEIVALFNGFLSEIISCLNIQNKKTRAVAGLVLVEGIIRCSDDTMTTTDSIDRMLQQIIQCLREKMTNNSTESIQYKAALSKALYLILSESRLARSVSRQQIVDTMAVITDIFANHDQTNTDRHLVYCAVDILAGLLKKKTENFNNIFMVDAGQCLQVAGGNGLLPKIRMPIKRVLKKMLKLWDYEAIKKCIPDELIPVLRNIHKSMNRSKRTEKAAKDHESVASSWCGASQAASQQTMKNPHIKGILELVQDSDSEDEDLKSRASGKSFDNKSTKSKASEMRKLRKRKIETANASLFLEEAVDDIVDISDPSSLMRHMRIADKHDKKSADKNVGFKEDQSLKKAGKTVDKRGFQFKEGRLIIGDVEDKTEVETKTADQTVDSEDDEYQSKKERFQPPKKRVRKEKLPGSEFKSYKKGVFGDMKKKDRPAPYAYVPLKSAEQCHETMSQYSKMTKKSRKAAVELSKSRKRRH